MCNTNTVIGNNVVSASLDIKNIHFQDSELL